MSTRGLEVQQEIKKRSKKARQYFEELGWRYEEYDEYDEIIEYTKEFPKRELGRISFIKYKEDKEVEYKIYNTWVDAKLNNAIQLQIKEMLI